MKERMIAVGVTVFLAVTCFSIWLYGSARYDAGHAAAMAEVKEAQEKYEGETNGRIAEAGDAADASRSQTSEKSAKIGTLERDLRDRDARIVGLLNVIAHSARPKEAGSMDDGERTKWVELFGSCRARAESLSIRYGEMGRDAANLADQVNGLQGYVAAVAGD